jgi:hypothetical protein
MTASPEVNKYFEMIKHDFNTLDLLTSAPPKQLEKSDFSDWQVTLLFYISCVYVKSVLGSLGIDIENHYSLRREITANPELKPFYRKYRQLEEASRDARYEGRKFDRSHIIGIILPKYFIVRDCIVGVLKKRGFENVPILDPTPFFKR